MENQNTEDLLEIAYTALDAAQQHLILGENGEGLSVINEAMRRLKNIDKHFYKDLRHVESGKCCT